MTRGALTPRYPCRTQRLALRSAWLRGHALPGATCVLCPHDAGFSPYAESQTRSTLPVLLLCWLQSLRSASKADFSPTQPCFSHLLLTGVDLHEHLPAQGPSPRLPVDNQPASSSTWLALLVPRPGKLLHFLQAEGLRDALEPYLLCWTPPSLTHQTQRQPVYLHTFSFRCLRENTGLNIRLRT